MRPADTPQKIKDLGLEAQTTKLLALLATRDKMAGATKEVLDECDALMADLIVRGLNHSDIARHTGIAGATIRKSVQRAAEQA